MAVLTAHVLAYGSLAVATSGTPAVLHGHRRRWGVAMDNAVDLPGYKAYVDPATGERPAVHVASRPTPSDASPDPV